MQLTQHSMCGNWLVDSHARDKLASEIPRIISIASMRLYPSRLSDSLANSTFINIPHRYFFCEPDLRLWPLLLMALLNEADLRDRVLLFLRKVPS